MGNQACIASRDRDRAVGGEPPRPHGGLFSGGYLQLDVIVEIAVRDGFGCRLETFILSYLSVR